MSRFAAQRSAALTAVYNACRVCKEVQSSLISSETIKKKDSSPVTVGDYAAQAIVIGHLLKSFDYPFIAEEDAKTLSAQPDVLAKVLACVRRVDDTVDEKSLLETLDKGKTKRVVREGKDGKDSKESKTPALWWTLDPIDGTSGFLRNDQYAVALALMEGPNVVLGVLGCPNLPVRLSEPNGARGCILIAEAGQGSYQYVIADGVADESKATRLGVSEQKDTKVARLTESVESRGYAQQLNEEICKELGVTAGPVRIDSQCKYAVVARGDSDVYLRLSSLDYQECIWDHAAGSIVVQEAGGHVTDFRGLSLDFTLGRTLSGNTGIVCTNGALYDRVMEGIRNVNPLGINGNKKARI